MVQSKHAQALLLGTGNNSWTLILDAREVLLLARTPCISQFFSSTCMALKCNTYESCADTQVYMRRKRWVLALHAVKRATAIAGPGSPEAHCMVLRFCHAAQSQQVCRSTLCMLLVCTCCPAWL